MGQLALTFGSLASPWNEGCFVKKTVFLFCLLAVKLLALKAGDQVPHFQLQDAGKEAWTPEAASKGRVLLIDFWASWCQPCIKEIPALNALSQRYAKSNFGLLGVSMDKDWDSTRKTIAKFDIRYPVALGTPAIAAAFGIAGFPTAVLIRDGKVLKVLNGGRRLAEFEVELREYLKHN
jgi:thiol-disulfide isomerase/thioredoxin